MSTVMPVAPRTQPSYEPLTVVTTDRWDEIEEALAVVHDGFVEAGYMEAQASGRRMIAPYLNDGVVFSLAYVGDEVAGVLVLMPDGEFGLPSDSAFRAEIDALRATGRPLFESGSLVVATRFRRHTRRILAGLVASNIRFFRETCDGVLIISTEPRQQGFYESLSGMKPISGVCDHYGAPAVLLAADYPAMLATMGRATTNGQRLIGTLVLDSPARWLIDHRCGGRWPADQVVPLIEEQLDLVPLLAPRLAPVAPVSAGRDRGDRGLPGIVRHLHGYAERAVGTGKEIPLGHQYAEVS